MSSIAAHKGTVKAFIALGEVPIKLMKKLEKMGFFPETKNGRVKGELNCGFISISAKKAKK